jgi:2-(3-amino-3-carboxypropyl)histidine synthase
MNVLYVFVDIKIDVKHFIDTVKYNLKPDQKVVMVATIQFVASLRVRDVIEEL